MAIEPGPQFDGTFKGPYVKGNLEHELELVKNAEDAKSTQMRANLVADALRRASGDNAHEAADEIEGLSGITPIKEAMQFRMDEHNAGSETDVRKLPPGSIDFTVSDLNKVDRNAEIRGQSGEPPVLRGMRDYYFPDVRDDE
jgi:hypothetical protein